MVINDNEALASYQTELVAEKAIDEMSIVLIKKIDIDCCEMALNVLLRNLRYRFEKLNNKFEEYEIPLIVEGILKQYYYLSLEEIAYVFNKGIMGTYLMPYNKLDSSVVFDWIHRYDSKERLAIAERRDANKWEEQRKLEEQAFKGVSKSFVDGMVKKIAEENNVKIESKQDILDKEKAYQMAKMKTLSSRKKFLDENGKEV